jgi:hypothetical protein
MSELLTGVAYFSDYLLACPPGQEQEEDEPWDRLYVAVTEFLDRRPFASRSRNELAAVLCAVAADEVLAESIGWRGDDLLLDVTEAAASSDEPFALWALVEELASPTTDLPRQESLLVTIAGDPASIVRASAVTSLASIGSAATERLALELWACDGDAAGG